MSKAYRCDFCGRIEDGDSDMQLQFDQNQLATFLLGIKFTPENKTAPVYTHDLCRDCRESFGEWCRNQRAAKKEVSK